MDEKLVKVKLNLSFEQNKENMTKKNYIWTP